MGGLPWNNELMLSTVKDYVRTHEGTGKAYEGRFDWALDPDELDGLPVSVTEG
jgi:hypothetical protein